MLFSYCCFSILFDSILRFQYTNINSFIKIYWYVFSWLVCLFVCLFVLYYKLSRFVRLARFDYCK